MSSRGTLISHRISGDTLANRDNVAMTPPIPSDTGSSAGSPNEAMRLSQTARIFPQPVKCLAKRQESPRLVSDVARPVIHVRRSVAADNAEFRFMAAKLTFATIPANARDS